MRRAAPCKRGFKARISAVITPSAAATAGWFHIIIAPKSGTNSAVTSVVIPSSTPRIDDASRLAQRRRIKPK